MIYRSLSYLSVLLVSGIALYELPSDAGSTILIREPFAIAQEPLETGPPVASVDASAPIQIRVINESTIDANIVSRLLTPPSDGRIAAPGESVTFGRLHTSFLPPPIELEIISAGENFNLDDLTLVVENNEIIITVLAQPGVSGEVRVVRVDELGDVYLL